MIIDSECSQGHLPPHLYFVVSKLAEVIVIMENSNCDKPLNQRTLSLMMCHLDQTNSDIKMSRTTNKTIFMEPKKIVQKCQVIQFSRFSQKFKILQSKVECHPELWFYKKRVDHVLDEQILHTTSSLLHCPDTVMTWTCANRSWDDNGQWSLWSPPPALLTPVNHGWAELRIIKYLVLLQPHHLTLRLMDILLYLVISVKYSTSEWQYNIFSINLWLVDWGMFELLIIGF